MYFDFEDQHPDIVGIESAFSLSTGVLFSLAFHVLLALAILFAPTMLVSRQARVVQEVEPQQLEAKREPTRFVFIQPRIDTPAPKPRPNAPASDKDRVAATVEKAPTPQNAQPFMRGNTPERVEATPPEQQLAQGRGNIPDPDELKATAPPNPGPPSSAQPETQIASIAPPATRPSYSPPSSGGRSGGGSLGNLNLRGSLDKYVTGSQFDNQMGSGPAQSAIQFDSKGVQFGPWLARFKALVQRNWDPLIPQAPMMMRMQGRVVITLNIHKDGTITDLMVKSPSPVDGYNTAAYGALQFSNPTPPLPPEYPADKAFFTITFFYNERPPDY